MASVALVAVGFILILIPEPATTLTGLFVVTAGLGVSDDAPVGGS